MNDKIIKYVLGTYQIIIALAVGIYYCFGSAMPIERDPWLTIWQFLDLTMVVAACDSHIRQRHTQARTVPATLRTESPVNISTSTLPCTPRLPWP